MDGGCLGSRIVLACCNDLDGLDCDLPVRLGGTWIRIFRDLALEVDGDRVPTSVGTDTHLGTGQVGFRLGVDHVLRDGTTVPSDRLVLSRVRHGHWRMWRLWRMWRRLHASLFRRLCSRRRSRVHLDLCCHHHVPLWVSSTGHKRRRSRWECERFVGRFRALD